MKIPTEYEDQKAIFEWADKLYFKELSLLNGSLNGVRLTIGQAVKAKKAGMRKGYPDIFLPVARNGYHGLFIELKRENGGTITSHQKQWLNSLKEQGYFACMCTGKDFAIRVIANYLNGGMPNRVE